jgi:hypothetical protein
MKQVYTIKPFIFQILSLLHIYNIIRATIIHNKLSLHILYVFIGQYCRSSQIRSTGWDGAGLGLKSCNQQLKK